MSKSMFTFGMLYTVIAFVGGIYGCSKQPVQLPAKPVVEHIKVQPPQEIPPGMEKALEFKIQPDGKVTLEETFVPLQKAEEKNDKPADALDAIEQAQMMEEVHQRSQRILIRQIAYDVEYVGEVIRQQLESAPQTDLPPVIKNPQPGRNFRKLLNLGVQAAPVSGAAMIAVMINSNEEHPVSAVYSLSNKPFELETGPADLPPLPAPPPPRIRDSEPGLLL